jgi:hypothetical protein
LVATAWNRFGGSRGFFLGGKLQVVHRAKDLAVFGLTRFNVMQMLS